MSKYEPLHRFLRAQTADEVPMTFAEIEKILRAKLPNSQFNRAWWSNNPNNNVMTRAWLDAHYLTEKVDIKNQRLVFRRFSTGREVLSDEDRKRHARWYGSHNSTEVHPLIGSMKGTVFIPEGVDLTEPADPEWGERAWGYQK